MFLTAPRGLFDSFRILLHCGLYQFLFLFFLSPLRLTGSDQRPIHRYGGFFLDEFSDLGPKEEECARILRFLVTKDAELRLVVAGYSLRSEHLQSILGSHDLLTATGRRYTLERCQITSPGDKDALLLQAVHFTLAALNREGDQEGNVIVFLVGWQEMCQAQKALKQKMPKLKIMMLHSDVIGNENEDVIETPEDDGRLVVYRQ